MAMRNQHRYEKSERDEHEYVADEFDGEKIDAQKEPSLVHRGEHAINDAEHESGARHPWRQSDQRDKRRIADEQRERNAPTKP